MTVCGIYSPSKQNNKEPIGYDAQLAEQDYKSVRAAASTYAILVNTQTDRQTLFTLLHYYSVCSSCQLS